MGHLPWHKDDGMTSEEAVARTQANVREEARRPSTWSPPPKPEPTPTYDVGHGEGKVDPGLAAAVGIGPAASGFSGTTVGQGEGITGIQTGEGKKGTGIDDVIKDTVIKGKEKVTDLWSQLPSIQMLKGITSLLNTAPTLAQLQDPNFLAIMNEVFKNDPTRKDKYVEDYKDIMAEALGMPPTMSTDTVKTAFHNQLENAEYEPGSEAERRIDPAAYYGDTMPQTVGGLEDFASINANEQVFNPETGQMEYKYDADFRQQIFNARQELDKATRGQGGGGGAGIMGAVPTPFTDVNNNGILDNLEVAQATTVPAATATTVPAATAATVPAATMTTPTPFDYSRWPQYAATNQYSWPNYVNQGLGQGPHFDYWNQIARTFPGMR